VSGIITARQLGTGSSARGDGQADCEDDRGRVHCRNPNAVTQQREPRRCVALLTGSPMRDSADALPICLFGSVEIDKAAPGLRDGAVQTSQFLLQGRTVLR